MAFQVLAGIAPDEALDLLGRLPQTDVVIGSVARKLPDFVSQFPRELRAEKLTQVSQAISELSPQSAALLTLALREAGFQLQEIPSVQAVKQKSIFKSFLTRSVKRINANNRRIPEHV